ncbi:hypothetical protein BH10CYA1_BH10CYA1_32550 [soil metagenome]
MTRANSPDQANTVENFGNLNSTSSNANEKFTDEVLKTWDKQSLKKAAQTPMNFSPNVSIDGDWKSTELEEQIDDLIPSDKQTYDELEKLFLEGNFVDFAKRFQKLQRSSSEPSTSLAEVGRLNAVSGAINKTFEELGFSFKFDSEGKSLRVERFSDIGGRTGTKLLSVLDMQTDNQGNSQYFIQFRNGLDYSKPAESTAYSITSSGEVTRHTLVEVDGLLRDSVKSIPSSLSEVNKLVNAEFESITDQKERNKKLSLKEEENRQEAQRENEKQQRELEQLQRDEQRRIEKQNRIDQPKSNDQKP